MWSESFDLEAVTLLRSWPSVAAVGALYGLLCAAVARGSSLTREGAAAAAGAPRLLDRMQLAHNLVMCLASVIMCVGVGRSAWPVLQVDVWQAVCSSFDRRGPIYFWLYVFFLSKAWEFIDTALLVARGRAVTFLHAFHHLATYLVSFYALESATTYSWVAMWTNCLIHSVMYFYYAYNSLTGQRLWWARYLTRVQMFQFLFNAAAMVVWGVARLLGAQCSGDWLGLVMCLSAMASYYVLFGRMAERKYAAGAKRQ